MIFRSLARVEDEKIVKRETFIGNDISLVAISNGNDNSNFNLLFAVHQDQDDSIIFIEVGAFGYGVSITNILEHKLHKKNIKLDPTRTKAYEDVVSHMKSNNCYKTDLQFEDTEKENYKKATLVRAIDGNHFVVCDLYVNLNTFFMISWFEQTLGYESNPEYYLTSYELNTMEHVDVDYIEMQSSTIDDEKLYTHYIVHSGVTGYSFNYIVSDADHELKDLVDPLEWETYKAMYENDGIVQGCVRRNNVIYLAVYSGSFVSNSPLGKKFKDGKKEIKLLMIQSDICSTTNLLSNRFHNVVMGE